MAHWEFQNLADTVVLANRWILEDFAWVFLVRRTQAGHWEFHPIDHLDRPRSELIPTTLGRVVSLDPTLAGVAELPCGWHAWRQTPNTCWDWCEVPVGATFCIQFEVRPLPKNPLSKRVQGAFAKCWLVRETAQEAHNAAIRGVTSQKWAINVDHGVHQALESSYASDDPSLRNFLQAQIDGDVFVFEWLLFA